MIWIKNKFVRILLKTLNMSEEIIKIDGGIGEGGGQVVRVAICLSALYTIPVEIYNIRVGRPKSGLSAQHLKGVEMVQEMCNAQVQGAHLGSTSLTFKPGLLKISKQTIIVDIKTAGCIGLLIQIALPCALFSSNAATYVLKGGTNVPFGPQIEYLTHVFRPLLQKFGGNLELEQVRKGFYPKGGGEVLMKVNPIYNLQGLQLTDSGSLLGIKGWSFTAGKFNLNIADEMAKDAKSTITRELSKRDFNIPPMDIKAYKESFNNAIGDGLAINLIGETSTGCIFGGSGLGSKNPKPIPPGIEAANEILAPILMDSCVDEHLQDQLIILMVLAQGPSKIKIGKKELTSHADTAIQVAKIMLKNKGLIFSLDKNEDNSYVLQCNGLGYKNKFLNS